ncbi:MAG: hypothetical protein JNL44_05135, partial [Gemmatimonadetes bacterium]|nr:hypothetical protein [Gemmatimonadota bacterium]
MRPFKYFLRPALVVAGACLLVATEAYAQTTVDGVIYASYRYGLTKDSSFATPA